MTEISEIKSKPRRLIKKTLLKFIRNSVGTRMFRNFYLEQYDKIFDATKNGELSCAFYVSSILVIFQLIKNVHGTVENTRKDLEASGWDEVNHPVVGSVIIWEPAKDQGLNEHIGFYIGRGKAISNNSIKKKIVEHDFTYDNTRMIKAIYSNPVLSE